MEYNFVNIFIAIVLGLALLYVFNILSRKFIKKVPPGPFPLPIIGHLHLLGDQLHVSLTNLAKTYGPIICLEFGQMTTVVISSPDMAREVLQKQDLAFSSRTVPDADQAYDHGKYSVIWMPVAPKWRAIRKIMSSQLFTNNRLDASQHLRATKIQELISYCNTYCQKGEAVDIGTATIRTTIDLLGNTFFSKDLTDSYSDFAKEFKVLVSKIMVEAGKPNLVDYFPVFRKFDPQGIRRRQGVYFKRVFELLRGLIDERLEERKKEGYVPHADMLDALLIACEDSPDEMDMTILEHLFLDLITGGTDSSSVTVEWAMAEVIKKPKVMKKLKEELTQVIGRGKPLEEADITRLPYLTCIVKETFRLHPAGPFLLPRKVEQDVKVNQYVVPKGSQVLVNVWAIGRDPDAWKNPLEFIPERFSQSEKDVRGHDFDLLPFGAGRRLCAGWPLAYRMVPLMFGSLMNCFDWKLEDDIAPETLDMAEEFGITLRKLKPLRAIPNALKA